MRTSVAILFAWLACAAGKSAKGEASTDKKVDCSAADAQIAKLTAEVESLRKQLAASSGTCSSEFSVMDAVSKGTSLAGDVVQHLLQQTDVDDKVVSTVSAQMEAAGALGSKVKDQIAAHPCTSDFKECVKPITSSDIYKTHLAAHVDTLTTMAQPHLNTIKPHMDTAMKHMQTAYGSTVEMAGVAQEKSGVALEQASTLASKAPDHLHVVLEPAFAALKTASPKHHHVLPKKPLDRLLLIIAICVFIYNFWFIVQIGTKLMTFVTKLALKIGIKLPFKVTTTITSWSVFFGTGFYCCGLCRRKRATESNGKPAADAKSQAKSSGKPATEKELTQLLDKAKEKGKLNDGVTRLVTAAKSGKPLGAPEEVKGKGVDKGALKKVLAKYKEVDIKKLGL